MKESGNDSGKKAYEVAYALWQIGNHTTQKVLSETLQEKALELITYSANGNRSGILEKAEALEKIIKFAVDVNCISIGNAAILMREIGNLKSAILEENNRQRFDDGFGNEIDIAAIFTDEKMERKIDIAGIDLQTEAIKETGKDSGNKAEIRQSAILEKIRQSGNCRLSDIQEVLPDTSERTLRYDLESLIQRNIIERFGPGGRSVYYRAK